MALTTQFVTGAGGVQLALSGAATRGIVGTSAAENLMGSAGNDSFRGGGGGDILKGNAGDDTYNIYDMHDVAVENANEGVDSVVATVSYSLGANIENLTVLSDRTYGGGNDLNNILNGGAGSQTLDGKGGNDVLTGGAGADVFITQKGGGQDLVTDFQNGVDSVRLDNFGLTSFGQVQSLMSQQGKNVVLNLGGGDSLTLANHNVADFSAQDFKLQLDTSKMSMTFDDEFNTLSLNDGTAANNGTWRTMFSGGGLAGRTLASNSEQEIYMDANFAGTGTTPLGVNPFSVNNGVVDITAAPASAAVSAAIGGYQYTSGLLTTKMSFAQQYGYFEVRAKLPSGQGLWPAFWLLPANGSWPPEIDVFEQLGKDPSTIFETSHSNVGGAHANAQQVVHLDNPDQFHTYGLLWDQNNLVWTIDGVEVGRQVTPADMNQPMYMLLNLAVGGSWPGNADPTTPFPATMSIDYVHVYQLNGQPVTTPTIPPTTPPVGPGTSGTSPPPVTLPPTTTTPPTTPPAANHAPVATNGSVTGAEDATVTGKLAATDQDANTLTYSVVSGPQHGSVTVNANGSYSYAPNANYNGPDSFTFKANDGHVDSNTATVSLTVTPVNDAPVAANSSLTGAEDTALSGAVSATDPDSITVSYSLVNGPQHGSVTLNANGAYNYTPNANYNGADSFTFKANDGQVDSNTATVNLTVTAVNDAPTTAGDTASVNAGSSLSIAAATLLANDSDPDGDALTVTGVAMGSNPHGTVQLTNGVVTYTPKAGYTGPDSVIYYVSDGKVTSPVAGTLTVNVTAAPQQIVGTSASDSFSVKMKDLSSSAIGVQKAISAFGGAGTWTAGDNDFLALSGFSKGSSLVWDHDSPANSHIEYYRIHDAQSGHDFMITINSTDGHHLAKGDFAFY